MKIYFCVAEPPCVAFAAVLDYLRFGNAAGMTPVGIQEMKKEDIVPNSIFLGTRWNHLLAEMEGIEARVYDPAKGDLLSFGQSIWNYKPPYRYQPPFPQMLETMNKREKGIDNEMTQAFLSGLRTLFAMEKDSEDMFEAFRWYCQTEKNTDRFDQAMDIGTGIAKHIETETRTYVRDLSFNFKINSQEMAGIISGPCYIGATHDALKRKHQDAIATFVIRVVPKAGVLTYLYSVRSWDTEKFDALAFSKERINGGGNAKAAGGSDGGELLRDLLN